MTGRVEKPRQCRSCQSFDHWQSSCPSYLNGSDGICLPSNIVPGEYAFYHAPQAPLQFSNRPVEIKCISRQRGTNRWRLEDDSMSDKFGLMEDSSIEGLSRSDAVEGVVDDTNISVCGIGMVSPFEVKVADPDDSLFHDTSEDESETKEKGIESMTDSSVVAGGEDENLMEQAAIFEVAESQLNNPVMDLSELTILFEKDVTTILSKPHREYFEMQYEAIQEIWGSPRRKLTRAISIMELLWDLTEEVFDIGSFSVFLDNVAEAPSAHLVSTLPLQKKGTVTVTCSDVSTLHGTNWINDSVINAMAGLLAKKHSLIVSFSSQQATLAFKEGKDEYHFKRMLQNDSLAGIRLFAHHKYLFFPYNIENTHWVLVVVDFRNYRVIYYDSLSNINAEPLVETPVHSCHSSWRIMHNALLFLEERAGFEKQDCTSTRYDHQERKEFNRKQWKMYTWHPKSPLQQDGHNCGVYTMLFMIAIANTDTMEYMPFGLYHPERARQLIAGIFQLYITA